MDISSASQKKTAPSTQPVTQPQVQSKTVSPYSKTSTNFTPSQNATAAIHSPHANMSDPSRAEARLSDTQPAKQNPTHKRSLSNQSASDHQEYEPEALVATRPGKRQRRPGMNLSLTADQTAKKESALQGKSACEQLTEDLNAIKF